MANAPSNKTIKSVYDSMSEAEKHDLNVVLGGIRTLRRTLDEEQMAVAYFMTKHAWEK